MVAFMSSKEKRFRFGLPHRLRIGSTTQRTTTFRGNSLLDLEILTDVTPIPRIVQHVTEGTTTSTTIPPLEGTRSAKAIDFLEEALSRALTPSVQPTPVFYNVNTRPTVEPYWWQGLESTQILGLVVFIIVVIFLLCFLIACFFRSQRTTCVNCSCCNNVSSSPYG